MQQKILAENLTYDGTIETALEALKTSKTVQTELKGFKVVNVIMSGNKIGRTLTIDMLKAEPCKEDVKETINTIAKALSEIGEQIIKDLYAKQENSHD